MMKNIKKYLVLLLAMFACTMISLPVFASEEAETEDNHSYIARQDAPEIDGLTYESTIELEYAQCFNVFYYADGYKFIDVPQSGEYLVVPEGCDAPEGLDKDIVVLYQPLDRTYITATAAYALIDAADANDYIKMTGTMANGWYIQSMIDKLNDGSVIYSGRYSEPDYETLIDMDCNLAIESTMIYHTPKVKEMLEDLGIPVFVERSSYEEHPLGRTEWIKLYGALYNKEAEAKECFDIQKQEIEELDVMENTGVTVVFFSVNSDGSVVIRHPSDYIVKMIDIAGGVYSFADLVTDVNTTSITMTMEEFYAVAINADIILYNATIENPLESIEDLISKNDLFATFKAVLDNKVYTTGKSMFQQSNLVGTMIKEIHNIIIDGDEEMSFFFKVE